MFLKKFGGEHSHDIGILALRLIVGLSFILHGWMKLQSMSGVISFFAMLGLPAFVAYLVMFVELVGGLAILVGFYTEYVTLPILVNMTCAVVLTTMKMGMKQGAVLGGHELELLLLFGALALAFIGSGKFSFDRKFRNI